MKHQTKVLVGVGLLAVAGYFLYQKYGKKSFAGFVAPDCKTNPEDCPCPCKNTVGTALDGTSLCANGHTCCGKKVGACPKVGGA